MFQTVFSRIRLCTILFLFVGCKEEVFHLPYYNEPDFTPHFIEAGESIEQEITHRIGDFSFSNQEGKQIDQTYISNRIHVANFIFTSCPSVCPVMTQNVKELEEAYANREDFAILSYSVTPWIDDVERLATYTKNQDIFSNNWHFLTGEKGKIYDLARTSYFAEEDIGFTKDSTEFLHTEHILLVDKTQRIRGIYNGTLQLEIKQLIKDVETLLQES